MAPFHHSAQKVLYYTIFPKYMKVKIYKTLILPLLLCGIKNWFLVLRTERDVNEGALRKYVRTCWQTGENYIMRSFKICT
jgi:hypothetical protein